MRNSAPFPIKYVLPDEAQYYTQSYPDCRSYKAGEEVIFAPHEVKVLNGRTSADDAFDEPCQLVPDGNGKYFRYLPASSRPDVLKIHQIPELQKIYCDTREINGDIEVVFGVVVPWRMRSFKMFLKTNKADCPEIEVRTSRFQNCRESSYAVPLTVIPSGIPGSGERKNNSSLVDFPYKYFTSDLPQGGKVYFSLTLKNIAELPETFEVWVSGYEAPARRPEPEIINEPDLFLPLAHPQGFPLNLRLM